MVLVAASGKITLCILAVRSEGLVSRPEMELWSLGIDERMTGNFLSVKILNFCTWLMYDVYMYFFRFLGVFFLRLVALSYRICDVYPCILEENTCKHV